MSNIDNRMFNLQTGKVSHYLGAEEQYGLVRASSRTHKQFLRKRRLGKFKKKQAK